MTMFVHHAIVYCGEDRCFNGETYCRYVRGCQPSRCELFGVELAEVPGTGTPARCDECFEAEGWPVAVLRCLVPKQPEEPEEPEEPWHRCCYDAVRASHCISWGTPGCTGPTHGNICHHFYPRPTPRP